MNDNDDAGDVHPLDQDYSEVESREKRQFKLPEGKVLRMDSLDGMRMTMTGYESGPFAEDTWNAPAGYQKQAMPFGR